MNKKNKSQPRILPITKKNARRILPLWLRFAEETKAHGNANPVLPAEDFWRRVRIRGSRPDMHFDALFIGREPVGFAQFAVDQGTIGGRIPPLGGVFLAFYIAPEHRRKGWGKRLFLHGVEHLFRDGAAYLYCCPDPVTGEPFWRAMGFLDSGIWDPDDDLPIYMRKRPEGLACRAMVPEDIRPDMMDTFEHYMTVTREVRRGRLHTLRRPQVEYWEMRGKFLFVKNWFIPKVYQHRHLGGEPLLFAAFDAEGNIKGFACLGDGDEKGCKLLLRLFVSVDCRRMGLGRELFRLCAEATRKSGFERMYISTEPAAETQAFYKSMGCTPAKANLFGPKRDVKWEYFTA